MVSTATGQNYVPKSHPMLNTKYKELNTECLTVITGMCSIHGICREVNSLSNVSAKVTPQVTFKHYK